MYIEQLAEISDEIAEAWLEGEHAGDAEKFPISSIKYAVKTATLKQQCVPVLCGSSFKNIGIQPLLDAVVDYLPPPEEVEHDFLLVFDTSFASEKLSCLKLKHLCNLHNLALLKSCLMRVSCKLPFVLFKKL